MSVPRGQSGFWRIIRELDAVGPWSIRDVDGRSNVDIGTVRDYVRRLVAGDFAEACGKRQNEVSWAMPSTLYRLTQSPLEAPRLRRDGSPCPEPQAARLWRTLKMAKVVTASELAALAETDRPVKPHVARRYLRELVAAGIVAKVSSGAPGREARYRLAANLGAKAPQVLRGHSVFDPNQNNL